MSKQKIKKVPNINARDFPTILGINPYQSAYQLLESKVEGKYPFFGNKFTEHGNKYEKLAIKTFEKIIDTEIDIYQSNRKHNEYNWITGRFDGITETKVKNKTNMKKKRKREDVLDENNERKKKKIKRNEFVPEENNLEND
jgi:predicted phage-related endonuclease